MGFEYKGYYLHKKGHLMFFSKQKAGCIDKPNGYSVLVNHRTGLPFLKKS